MCCGSRRSAWRSTFTPPRAAPAPLAPETSRPAPPNFGSSGPGVTLTKLRYWDNAPIRLRGPITGRAYSFSGIEPVQEVDIRDAAILLRSNRPRLSAP